MRLTMAVETKEELQEILSPFTEPQRSLVNGNSALFLGMQLFQASESIQIGSLMGWLRYSMELPNEGRKLIRLRSIAIPCTGDRTIKVPLEKMNLDDGIYTQLDL